VDCRRREPSCGDDTLIIRTWGSAIYEFGLTGLQWAEGDYVTALETDSYLFALR
jgi:hypothetical protein